MNLGVFPTIGYQYHFRDRWTMGVEYTWAEVTSDTLAYPDFDNSGNYAYFQYVVKLNSFLASIDYAWKIKNSAKSSYALYSGIALGNSRIDYNTVRMNYDKSSSYIPAFNGGVDMNGFQVTTISPNRTLHPIQKEAMTFMLTNNANRLVDSIAIGLQIS